MDEYLEKAFDISTLRSISLSTSALSHLHIAGPDEARDGWTSLFVVFSDEQKKIEKNRALFPRTLLRKKSFDQLIVSTFRDGDQILKVNSKNVEGWTRANLFSYFKKLTNGLDHYHHQKKRSSINFEVAQNPQLFKHHQPKGWEPGNKCLAPFNDGQMYLATIINILPFHDDDIDKSIHYGHNSAQVNVSYDDTGDFQMLDLGDLEVINLSSRQEYLKKYPIITEPVIQEDVISEKNQEGKTEKISNTLFVKKQDKRVSKNFVSVPSYPQHMDALAAYGLLRTDL